MLKKKLITLILFSFVFGKYLCDAQGSAYYVSAGTGSDVNSGTIDKPFKTIQKAANVMIAGDTCYIKQGIYHELVFVNHSGTANNPITFIAYPGETPVVSGADALELNWSIYEGQSGKKNTLLASNNSKINLANYEGKIYKASVEWQFDQLFVDGEMMNEARWPNAKVNQLVTMPRATCDSGTNATTLVDAALPAGNWNGGTVHIVPGSKWVGYSKEITNYKPGKSLTFGDSTWQQNLDHYIPKSGNSYWIYGCLDGLDIATEWYLDKNTNIVYLWCPGNPDPAKHRIEAKKRDYAFDLSGQKYIQIKGLRIFAASPADTDYASDCLIEDCHVKYIEHFNNPSGFSESMLTNKILGTNITFKNCSIAYSAGNGLYDTGQSNKIINCIIHDVGYMATYAAAINCSTSSGGEYRNNTLYNAGRYIFRHKTAPGFKFEYNDIYNGGMLTEDCGMTTCGYTDGNGAVIAYNKVHDNKAGIGIGIYLDNNSSNFIVHHNLVWGVKNSAIRLNCPSLNNSIYNNTALSTCKDMFNHFTAPGGASDQTGTKVINNLYKCPLGRLITGDLAPQADHNGNYAIDSNSLPGVGSGAIDTGAIIEGITDGFVGQAPDIGCFELGTIPWSAGADWTEIPW